MFDKKDPARVATHLSLILFVVFIGVLYLAKPTCVQIIHYNGMKSICWKTIILYSAIFSTAISMIVFLTMTSRDKSVEYEKPPNIISSLYF